MCFDPAATPPAIPADVLPQPSAVRSQALTLTTEDGASLTAYSSVPDAPREVAVVVLPDVRGLFDYYKRLADRLASAGHHAVAIDYFARTEASTDRGPDFEFMPHVRQLTVEQVLADARVAATHLREVHGIRDVVTIGFCLGGTLSYYATTDPALGVAGAIAFYGGLDGSRLGVYEDPAEHADRMRGPLLAIYGGADQSITQEMRERFDEALTAGGVEHEFVVFDGAPHSFFDRTHGDHAEACDESWGLVLRFLQGVGNGA